MITLIEQLHSKGFLHRITFSFVISNVDGCTIDSNQIYYIP
jgi:hypothetical protein